MFDVTKADHAVNFINCLKHTKGKWRGVPFQLLGWQDEIIRTLFGTVDLWRWGVGSRSVWLCFRPPTGIHCI